MKSKGVLLNIARDRILWRTASTILHALRGRRATMRSSSRQFFAPKSGGEVTRISRCVDREKERRNVTYCVTEASVVVGSQRPLLEKQGCVNSS